MEEESGRRRPSAHSFLSAELKAELINNIKSTYQGTSSQQIRAAEKALMQQLKSNYQAVCELFALIKPPFQMEKNFRNSCGVVLKKFYYLIADPQVDMEPYIQQCYDLLVCTNYDEHRIKESIGVALEYIFNKDEDEQYKTKWIKHARTQLLTIAEHPEAWTAQTLEVIHGLTLVFVAYLNSLSEPYDQAIFMTSVLQPLCKAASLCANFAKDNIAQSIGHKMLFLAPAKIFQLLEIATQRLLEQQQIIEQEVSKFRYSNSLQELLREYTLLFASENSIITKYKPLNEAKGSLLHILYYMNLHGWEIDPVILQALFLTFVAESTVDRDEDDDDQADKIICKTFNILEDQLANRVNEEFFMRNKIEILFSLLMYCRTGSQELTYMVEEPERFLEIAEQFSESFTTSPLVKVRASHFIKVFVEKIDEGLSNLVELCIIFITVSLKNNQHNSELVSLAVHAYKDFPFMQLPAPQKLEICYMVLTILHEPLQTRLDLKTVVTSILITNCSSICAAEDELVLLRLVRLLGYYPTSIYFSLIQKLMPVSRVFLLEAMACFERISKNKQYMEAFPLMHVVYMNIVQYIEVGDTIFESLVLKNYHSILVKNQQLFKSVLQILVNTFLECVNNLQVSRSKQKAITCLNYMEHIIKTEKSAANLAIIEQAYLLMQKQAVHIELFEENFISIYEVLLSRSLQTPQQVHQLVLSFSAPARLHHYPNYTPYFHLLNKFIIRTDDTRTLAQIQANFLTYLTHPQQQKYNHAIMPQLCHCIGHIALVEQSLGVAWDAVEFCVEVVLRKEESNQYVGMNRQWYLFLVLHYVYLRAGQVREGLLKGSKYYGVMIAVFTGQYTTKIDRKVALLAVQELLGYETEPKSQLELIKFCITLLKSQKQIYKPKKKSGSKRNSQLIQQEQEQHRHSEQQHMSNEQPHKDEDNIHFKDFKHPFDTICEFSTFRHKVLGLNNVGLINEQSLPGITDILQYEWHKDSVRRVVRIAQ